MSFKHEVILCIVNNGFSEAVMDAARAAGAQGGTVIHARGTANKEAEQFFNISIIFVCHTSQTSVLLFCQLSDFVT